MTTIRVHTDGRIEELQPLAALEARRISRDRLARQEAMDAIGPKAASSSDVPRQDVIDTVRGFANALGQEWSEDRLSVLVDAITTMWTDDERTTEERERARRCCVMPYEHFCRIDSDPVASGTHSTFAILTTFGRTE